MKLDLSAAERNLVLCSLLAYANTLEAEIETTPGMPQFFQSFVLRKIEILDEITDRLEALENPEESFEPPKSD